MRWSDFIITSAGKICKLIRARRIRNAVALARIIQRQVYARRRLPALFIHTNINRAGIGVASVPRSFGTRSPGAGAVVRPRLFRFVSGGCRLVFLLFSATPISVGRLASRALRIGVIGGGGDNRKQQQQE